LTNQAIGVVLFLSKLLLIHYF